MLRCRRLFAALASAFVVAGLAVPTVARGRSTAEDGISPVTRQVIRQAFTGSHPAPAVVGGTMTMEQEGDAHSVLQRAVRAKGGADVLRSIKTIVMSGTITVAGPVVAQMTNYIEYPDRFRQDAKLPNGEVIQVYSHGETWMKDASGVHDVPASARPNLAATVSRDVISLLLAAMNGKLHMELVPVSGQASEAVDDLRLSGPDLAPVELLVDRVTGNITGKRYVVEQPGAVGKVPTEERYSDYRTVDGLRVAFKTIVRRGEATIMEQTLSDFRVNAPVAASVFLRPPQ